jgi:tight adherence protein C
MTSPMVGGLLGLIVAIGLLLAIPRIPAFRRPSLDHRLAPYLRDAPQPSRLLLPDSSTFTPFPTLERLVRPLLTDGVHVLDRVLGGSASVRRRLDQVGREPNVEAFRLEQLMWGVAGLVVGVMLSLMALATGVATRPAPLLVLTLLSAVCGVLMRDRWLTHEVSMREARMMMEFPTIAEMLALAVAAGEGAVGALERVTRVSHGELARELARALTDARAGASLVLALEGVAKRTTLPALSRFADGVAIAVERGTPLADVLRAQAADVREAGKRALLEAGARKEISMMVPVVFLVLPITVIFALFPGFYGLTLSVP